jgi:type IV secretory pathway VirB4 component
MVPGPALAASFPFSSSFYDPDLNGVLLGFNANNIPIVKSMWKLDKYIGAVIGSSGSGKSYASKAFILNEQMISGTKTFILDPEGEYVDMARNIKGSQVISLDKNSKSIPNIFDLMGSDFIDKIASLPKVFEVLLEGITDTQKPLLEDAIIETYKLKGIVEDDKKSWGKKCPKLSDLYKVLEDKIKKIKDERLRSDVDILLAKLSRYTRGIFKFVDQSDHDINMNSPFIVFEFKNMTEEIRPIMMLILLEFVKTKFNVDNERKLLVLDEAWRMLKSKYEAQYIENFARTFRKRRGAMLLITQSVSELKGSQEGKAFLANTSFRYILKTENIVLDETCELFGLNQNEKKVIANAKTGQGILIWSNKHYNVTVKVDPKTHSIITTNPEEKKV